MYKTILAPLDGSKRAEKILPHIEELGMRFEARIIFLQVVEPAPLVTDAAAPHAVHHQAEYTDRRKEAETYLAGRAGIFKEKGVTARTRIGGGPVVESIINTAESEDADLVAIASHGRTGLSQVFYGSVAAGLLHRIDRPLLLIRAL
ncbi:MAG: universal stress protein [Desulfohalobiaceae bacterium]|nr:universal stress protein [Desulfohalobiaceae bacterium]